MLQLRQVRRRVQLLSISVHYASTVFDLPRQQWSLGTEAARPAEDAIPRAKLNGR
jgi:hypothetical protein